MYLKYTNIIIFLFSYTLSTFGGPVISKIAKSFEEINIEESNFPLGLFDSLPAQKKSNYNDTVGYSVNKKGDSIMVNFIIISDQDRDAKIQDSKGKTVYASTVEMGTLTVKNDYSAAKIKMSKKTQNLTTKLNYDGRGAEFSDLKWFNGNLMTVDDKTGVIYKIDKQKLVAAAIMSDGLNDERLYKGEWLTVKDGKLYVGGYGKEYTINDGTKVSNYNPMYIKVFSPTMGMETLDWKENFINVRKSIGIEFPAYTVNEAVQWSNIHKKWFFLPRKVSKNPYTDEDAENAGSNILIMANEDFTQFSNVKIGKIIPQQGFSGFQFVPGTDDNVIVAIKSEETEKNGMSSYIMVFKIDGTVLYGPRRIPGKFKMEGIEFLDWQKEFDICKTPK